MRWPLSWAIGARPMIMAACLADKRADLGEAGDQRGGGDGSDARDGGQDRPSPGQNRVGGDPALDLGGEIFDRRFGRADLAFDFERAARDAGRAELVAQGGAGGDGGVAAAHQFLQAPPSPADGGVAAGSRLSPRIASILQSMPSVLARAPKASANRRARNGLTTATAKPLACRLRWAAR